MKPNGKSRLIVAFAVLSVLGAGVYLGWSQFDNLYVKLALFAFQRNPSQATADTLVELLDAQAATPAQARRILARLLTPKVTKADSYLLGTVPTVRVEFPFELAFANMIGDVTEGVYVDGRQQSGKGAEGIRTFKAAAQSLQLHPMPTRPGVYNMEIRYSYCLTGERKPAWQWTSFKGIPWPRYQLIDISHIPLKERQYKCRFLIPLQIVVEHPARQPG
jgi:hypothetical protein